MRSFSSPSSSLVLLLVLLTANNVDVEAFLPLSSRIQSASATAALYASKEPSSRPSNGSGPVFLHQLEGENDAAYFKRLSETASDHPMASEKMVAMMEKTRTTKPKTTKELNQNSRNGNSADPDVTVKVDETKKQRGYQRAEDWEAEQLQEQKEMSWEEKVMYDGQQDGDKFEQNEILRKNLHG
jgi:hypothetical protein